MLPLSIITAVYYFHRTYYLSLILILLWFCHIASNTENILNDCCAIGRNSSINTTKCKTNFINYILGLPFEQQGLCQTTIELCCLQSVRDAQCEEGKNIAREGGSCNVPKKGDDSNIFKYCCEACKLGLLSASESLGCRSVFKFGSFWDNVYESCCSASTHDLQPSSTAHYIDECLSGPCDINQVCVNTHGKFMCQCKPGFQMDSIMNTCIDVNECQMNLHNCISSQRCDNTVGAFQCIRYTGCGTGYTLNSQTSICEDDDECVIGTHNCHTLGSSWQCRNTLGSFRCEKKRHHTGVSSSTSMLSTKCPKGYKVDNGSCIDIDECVEENQKCEHKCINIQGSFKCSCNAGYILNQDNSSCSDINECESFKQPSVCVGACINLPGTYKCGCPDGYRLGFDSETCIDIDECSIENRCTGPEEACLNMRGSFRCNTITCPPNYVKDPDHKNRCKKQETFCNNNTMLCLLTPISYSFHYISLVSNVHISKIGRMDLFNIRGPAASASSVEFALSLENVHAPSHILKSTKEYFQLSNVSHNQVVISLIKPIPGPQDIELHLQMRFYSNKIYAGLTISKLFIYISAYEF